METILVTGGAGLIGSHLAGELLDRGYQVRALDTLTDQVHGAAERPDYLSDDVELIVGDVRDCGLVREALHGVDAVVHLAARVGVGQSMYELAEYVGTNSHGTAVLLEAMLDRPVRKLIVASSMSIYGEGAYDPEPAQERTRQDLERRRWEPRTSNGRAPVPIPTPETKLPANSSVYALTKYDQERLCLLFGAAYDVPTVALRFFNVYGPHQALSNPYTGVLAIFASRLLNGNRPLVFEDGCQRRDFVNVKDAAHACVLALERDGADGRAVNIGSGRSVTVVEIARKLGEVIGVDLEPELTGKFRAGDIRHCFADIALARELLGFHPQVELEEGLAELAEWLATQTAEDRVDGATEELVSRGLAR
jgi:dTDP-L-rhamnose 4-epimerase